MNRSAEKRLERCGGEDGEVAEFEIVKIVSVNPRKFHMFLLFIYLDLGKNKSKIDSQLTIVYLFYFHVFISWVRFFYL